jgi:hypothetical protein
MKKLILICLLGYLCVPTSTLTAQVADSPPGDDLVDNPGLPGQEGESPSARLGENQILIYVELAKKGELDTLTFETFPFMVSTRNPNYRQEETHLVGRRANFFSGINPDVDQVFRFSSAAYLEPGYISLKRGEVEILDKYLVFPGDSVKIRINPDTYSIVFSGPSAALFECQYYMALAKEAEGFANPAIMYTADPEEMLGRKDYRTLFDSASVKFGSHMRLVARGEEQDSYLISQLNKPLEELAEWQVLQRYKGRISEEGFELLKADILGGYLASVAGSVQSESYQNAIKSGEKERRDRLASEMRSFLQDSEEQEVSAFAASHSLGWIRYQYSRAYWKAILSGTSFSSGVIEDYSGDLRAKVLLRYLVDNFSRIRNKVGFIDKIEPYLESKDQQSQLLEYRNKYIAGAPVRDFSFVDESGRKYSKSDFTGKLTLFYFWVTGCMGSEQFYRNQLDSLAALFPPSEDMAWVAVNASTSPDTWRIGLESGNYTDDRYTNLYLGTGEEDWRKYYNIYLFPQLMLMDAGGNILELDYLNQPLERLAEQLDEALSSDEESSQPTQTP